MALNKAQLMDVPGGPGVTGSVKQGTGITISADGTTSLTPIGATLTPGSYTNTNLTVDQYGRITAAANGGSGPSDIYILKDTNGANQAVRTSLDFTSQINSNDPAIGVFPVTTAGSYTPFITGYQKGVTAASGQKKANLTCSPGGDGFLNLWSRSNTGVTVGWNETTGACGVDIDGVAYMRLAAGDKFLKTGAINLDAGPTGTGNASSWLRLNQNSTNLQGWIGQTGLGIPMFQLQSGDSAGINNAGGTLRLGCSTGTIECYNTGSVMARINSSGCQGTSDINLKQNVEPFTDGLQEILQLDPISYEIVLNSPFDGMLDPTQPNFVYCTEEIVPAAGNYLIGAYLPTGVQVVEVRPVPGQALDPEYPENITYPKYIMRLTLSEPHTYTGSGEYEDVFTARLIEDPTAGFSAQAVQNVIPLAVPTIGTNFQGDPVLGMNFNVISATLVNAVKELSAQVAALQAQVAALTP